MTLEQKGSVKLLVEALRIYSPTTKEAPLAEFLCDKMRELGYSRVRVDKAGNAIGEAGRGGARLLLCGHMDTVPGELAVRRAKYEVCGRGASDAKSPLCAFLLAGATAADSGVHVTFTGATEEEGAGAGVEELIRDNTKFDFAVFGEPGGAHKVTVGYRGRVSVKIRVRTAGGHAGSPWAHDSAFDEFCSVLSKLKDYEASKTITGDHFRSVSLSPTIVNAGSFHNVVPSLCEAVLDLRVPPGMPARNALREITSIVKSGFRGEVDVEPGEATEAFEASPSSTLVRAFQRAILLKLKAKPALVKKTGTGDMNTFAQKRGIECVTYGPGDPTTSHTDSETVRINDYLNSIIVLKEAIIQLGILARRPA